VMHATAEQLFDEPDDDAVIHDAWERGLLSYKLDPHQLRVYDRYREWEQLAPANENAGEMHRVFVMDISRRWGKTFLCVLIKFEDCLRMPGSFHTYACAFAKDIADIVLPLADEITADAPDHCSPKFQSTKEGQSMGLFFKNGSVLRLVGIDKHPKGLRGRFSDGFVVSEAGHVVRLANTIRNVVYPQFQRKPHARLILESNAPEDPEHDFDTVFVEDAKLRGAYVFQTIDDNEALDPVEKAEFIKAAGGTDAPTCQREYYGVRVRESSRVVLPEFDESRHVVAPCVVPAYAHCYESIDPGMRDKLAIGHAFWDFERAKLVIQRSYAEANVTTSIAADYLKRTERELWHQPGAELRYWSGNKFKLNPYLRVSDTDARMIADLSIEHGLRVHPTAKDDADAQLYSLRNAFLRDKIEIWEDSGPLAAQCKAATWNDKRTDWDRSDVHGHYDCVAMLIYLWRNVIQTLNPFPPDHVGKDRHEHFLAPGDERKPKTPAAAALERVMAGKSGNRWKRGPRNAGWRR
jgi:hypothetical protein